ncbi:DUF192 domain-containing protein [Sphingobium sp. CR28]|uniref:DUF192 domain-containing protein n=1 Tax=Sphingobium sp. CR28 TaxID=3400272 RepID=UPI003FEE334B
MKLKALTLSCCVLTVLFLSGCSDRSPVGQGSKITSSDSLSTTAIIATDRGEVTLHLEVAADSEAQEKGLMGRKQLPIGSGMLFPFDPPRTPNFWMKGTLIPLDLIFVRSDGTISAVMAGKPGDLTPISTGEPVRGVIEIGGNEARRFGISAGDRVKWGKCDGAGQSDPLSFCPN